MYWVFTTMMHIYITTLTSQHTLSHWSWSCLRYTSTEVERIREVWVDNAVRCFTVLRTLGRNFSTIKYNDCRTTRRYKNTWRISIFAAMLPLLRNSDLVRITTKAFVYTVYLCWLDVACHLCTLRLYNGDNITYLHGFFLLTNKL